MPICKNCFNPFENNYCSYCGEKNYTVADKSVWQLVKETFSLLTNFEGRLYTTLKALFLKPGQLSKDYCNGIRQKYFKPLALFLFIVVLYLIFPVFSGLNMELKYYKQMPFTGKLISIQIDKKITNENVSEETFAVLFHDASVSSSKLLLFILIPGSAFLLFLLNYRKKDLWFDRLVLATEMNIIYLLCFFLLFPPLFLAVLSLTGLEGFNDETLGLTLTGVFGLYASIIFRKYFQNQWTPAFIKGMLFAAMHAFILISVYKFLVFELTLLLV